MIRLNCSGCGQPLHVPPDLAGTRVRCGGCNQPMQVPAAEDGLALHEFSTKADTLGSSENLPGSPPGPDPDQGLYDFLSPPQEPGERGRLGRFRILGKLGQGGMGVVYRAWDPELQRPVALKALLPGVAHDPANRQRFLREARAAAALEHDYIVSIYDLGEDRGIPFLAMPLLQGESLADRLQRPPRLPLAEVVRLGREIAEGLAAAHARGLIHRDIKPGNIWLEGSRGRVKVLDFGLARSTDDPGHLTKTGFVLGTPAYMAPEQAAGAAVDQRCDLFSLGCLLYQLCTGELPFQGSNLVSLVVAVATQEPRPVEELNPAVPPALAELVRRLLAKRREERPASAQAVAQALQTLATVPGEPGVLAPGGLPPGASAPGSPGKLAGGGLTPPPAPAWPPPLRERPARLPPAPSPSSGPLARPQVGRVLMGGGILLLLGLGVFALWHSLGENGPEQKPVPFDPQPGKRAGEVVTNPLGMKFAWCPPGTFLMGSPKTEKVRSTHETQHRVTLTRGFYLAVHEVTQKQWQAVMGNNPSHFKGDDLPVDTISWDDCQEFCRKLGQQDGKRYRLPTEAEWEYACRAGTDEPRELGDHAWYDANSDSRTHRVGTKKPNAWGLFDMHGNVWEWCQDRYRDYPSEDIKDPKVQDEGDVRVVRGGSWRDDLEYCRAARRYWIAPVVRHDSFGLRVCFRLD